MTVYVKITIISSDFARVSKIFTVCDMVEAVNMLIAGTKPCKSVRSLQVQNYGPNLKLTHGKPEQTQHVCFASVMC